MNFQEQLSENGFAIIEQIFSQNELERILQEIEIYSENNSKNNDIFAIRCFLLKVPTLKNILLNEKITSLLSVFGENYKVVKAIYFDKPKSTNWLVNWHQDLTISVKEKFEIEAFSKWLPKKYSDKNSSDDHKEGYFSVQPTQKYLDNILTIRIHLDDCTKENGALRVLPKTHKIIQNSKDFPTDYLAKFSHNEQICEIKKGGILLMKPLILHSSKRTENNQKRRVIHLEFSNLALPKPLIWAEL